MERHEGKISFVSKPGVATSFFFDLPEFTGTLPARTPAGAKDFDKVTGLFNKRYFEMEFKKELARAERAKISLALILIEADGFDSYCEEHGDEAGDEFLKKIASTLSALIKRPGDLLGRYTHEMLIALLPDTGEKGAAEVMEKMRSRIGELDMHSFDTLTTHIVGEAIIPQRATGPEMMIESVKDALKETKTGNSIRSGR